MSCHHVCDFHVTASSLNRCQHSEEEPAVHPQYLEPNSAPHKAVTEVILGKKLRQKLPFVARYRLVPRRKYCNIINGSAMEENCNRK